MKVFRSFTIQALRLTRLENFSTSWICKRAFLSRVDAEIDSIYEQAIQAGATGAGCPGAGGGGSSSVREPGCGQQFDNG